MDFFWLQICCVGLNRLQMSHLCFGYLVRTHETVYYEYGGRKSAMLQRFQPLDTLHVHPFISSMWKLMHRVCCTLCLWVTAPLFLHPFVVSYMSQNASQFSQDFTFRRRWVLSFYHQTYSGKLRLHARKKQRPYLVAALHSGLLRLSMISVMILLKLVHLEISPHLTL